MDKVLSRPIFKNTYLKTIKKPISNFSKGGIAALGVKKYNIGGFNTLSQEDMDKLTAMTIAGSLLQGVRQPGQSQASALLSNLGTGVEKAVPVIMEGQKINAEGNAKLMSMFTTLEPVIDAKTGETRFANKLEIMNSAGNLKPQSGFIPQIVAATAATEKTKLEEQAKQQAKDKLIQVSSNSALQEKLKSLIANPKTFTGSAADYNLLVKNIGGSIGQVLNVDQLKTKDEYADANYQDVANYLKNTGQLEPDLTQEAQTLKTQLVYANALALADNKRINQQEIIAGNQMNGSSGNKTNYITGVSTVQQSGLNKAIDKYNVAFANSPNENMLLKAQQDINKNGIDQSTLDNPYARVLVHRDNVNAFLGVGQNTPTTTMFGGNRVNTNLYGTQNQTNRKPDAFSPANVFGVKPITVNPTIQ